MSTYIFGARVMGLDHENRDVLFRVFVTNYDTPSRGYISLPEKDDPEFFLCLLWESARWEGALGEAVTDEEILDFDWLIAHTPEFVEHTERTAARNDPPGDDVWPRLHDFYSDDEEGRWPDEDLLAQADFTVRVTDTRWMEHLSLGQSWSTTFFPLDHE